MWNVTAPTLQKSWLRGWNISLKPKSLMVTGKCLTPTRGLITVPMGNQTCLQHPFRQPVSSYFLNILGCSLNAHVTQVSGVANCWFQRKPGDATPACLPTCLSPCLYFPLSIKTWTKSLIGLVAKAVTSFILLGHCLSFLSCCSDKIFRQKPFSSQFKGYSIMVGSGHSHGPGSQPGDGDTHSEQPFPSQLTQWR